MQPASRTPEGEPNRCPLCGNALGLEPSRPPGDAPCPFCGSLLWFDSARESDPVKMPNVRIRLQFRGGCKDGLILAGDPKSLAAEHGQRYCGLAVRGRVGTRVWEVPIAEYGKVLGVLSSYRPARRLCAEEVRDVVAQLQHVKTHVYEVTRRDETPEAIEMTLDFVCRDEGIRPSLPG